MRKHKLHNHPIMERIKRIDKAHVIIDLEEFHKAFRLQDINVPERLRQILRGGKIVDYGETLEYNLQSIKKLLADLEPDNK